MTGRKKRKGKRATFIKREIRTLYAWNTRNSDKVACRSDYFIAIVHDDSKLATNTYMCE